MFCEAAKGSMLIDRNGERSFYEVAVSWTKRFGLDFWQGYQFLAQSMFSTLVSAEKALECFSSPVVVSR